MRVLRHLRFSTWPVRLQMLAGPLVLLLVLLATVAVVVPIYVNQRNASELVTHTYAVKESSTNLASSVLAMNVEIDQLGSIAGQNVTAEESRLAYVANQRRAHEETAKLRLLVRDSPAQQVRLDVIEQALQQWERSVGDEVVRLSQGSGDVRSLFITSARQIDRILTDLRAFESAEDALLIERSAASEDADALARTVFVVTPLLALLAFASAFLAGSRVLRPVRALSAAAQRIAAGDLSARVPVHGTNEFAQMGTAFNTMATSLGDARNLLTAQNAQLAASEERLTRIFETIADGVTIMDRDGRFELANAAAERILRLGRSELVDVPYEIPPWRRLTVNGAPYPDEQHPFLVVQRTGEPLHDQEIMLEHLDGTRSVLNFNSAPLRDANGEFAGIVSSFTDITARHDKDAQLRRTLAQLDEQYREAERARSETRAVLDATGEAIALVGDDRVFLSVNRRFCEFFDIAAEDVVGHRFEELLPRVQRTFADPAALIARVGGSSADRESYFSDFFMQAWPEQRELELSSMPVHGDGVYLGRLYVLRDVTREREVDRMKTEFVSLVSHELRTPLTSIKGYVDLLLDGDVGPLAEEQLDFLGIVKNNADRLVGLINDLLDISRIESGKVELQRAPVDIALLIGRVSEMMRPLFEAKGQRLSLELPPAGTLVAWADADRVTQVVTNLLSNAYKYTPAGGNVTARARADAGQVRVEVQDSGIGLSPEEQSQLFTRFFRASNRTTQEVGGTGLGLTITRSLVEMHGGEISVTSAPGEGSTFSFTLPASTTAVSPSPAPIAPAGGRILVVDDEPEIAGLIRRYLERAGYTVLVAHDGTEALRLARSEQPDLITLDIMLPGADGFTVLEWLKSDPVTAAVPVVMISIVADGARGRLLGAVDYLAKPVQERALLQRVALALTPDHSRRVLVTDDDPDVRRLLVTLLRQAGYAVSEARDGEEALELARKEQPGLVLMDIRMPRMDGIAALRELRADPATRELPVLMMTTSANSEENRALIEALGGAMLFSKPGTAQELADALARGLAMEQER